jgi:hypothetical protein
MRGRRSVDVEGSLWRVAVPGSVPVQNALRYRARAAAYIERNANVLTISYASSSVMQPSNGEIG